MRHAKLVGADRIFPTCRVQREPTEGRGAPRWVPAGSLENVDQVIYIDFVVIYMEDACQSTSTIPKPTR